MDSKGSAGDKSPSGSSHLSFFSKDWDPPSLCDRGNREEKPYVEYIRSHFSQVPNVNNEQSLRPFLQDYDDPDSPESPVKVRDMEEFWKAILLIDVQSGTGPAVRRRAAWLDERNHARAGEVADFRPSLRALNATELYLLLKEPVRKFG